jgi:hypothetical protein
MDAMLSMPSRGTDKRGMLSLIAATGNKKCAVGKKERCPGDRRRKENVEGDIYYCGKSTDAQSYALRAEGSLLECHILPHGPRRVSPMRRNAHPNKVF